MADNDTDISKAHLNKEEQIIKVDFYLQLQNTENFALSALRENTFLINAIGYTRLFVNRRKIYKSSMEISEMNNRKITKF